MQYEKASDEENVYTYFLNIKTQVNRKNLKTATNPPTFKIQ